MVSIESILKGIDDLKKEKNAVILAHNYQRPEIQEISDYLGDSLELSRKATKARADIILFCGVKFMAETAKILSPHKKVLQPREEAGCELANKITAEDVRDLKKKYPEAKVVSYVNSNADVKAESDVCCTSSNAVNVVKNIDSEKVIFVPDRNLAAYVSRFVDKEIIPWDGYCYVHENITDDDIQKARELHPEAVLVVHPECRPSVTEIADEVLSTGGMVSFAGESEKREFIIGTEEGLIYRLKRENPEKRFYPVAKSRFCWDMKMTTLKDVFRALGMEQYEVDLSDEIISGAKNALERMLDYL